MENMISLILRKGAWYTCLFVSATCHDKMYALAKRFNAGGIDTEVAYFNSNASGIAADVVNLSKFNWKALYIRWDLEPFKALIMIQMLKDLNYPASETCKKIIEAKLWELSGQPLTRNKISTTREELIWTN